MKRSDNLTLLDLVKAVSQYAETADEMKAVVAHLVNSGKVRLCGSLAGSRVDLSPPQAYVPRLEPATVRSLRVLPRRGLNRAGIV